MNALKHNRVHALQFRKQLWPHSCDSHLRNGVFWGVETREKMWVRSRNGARLRLSRAVQQRFRVRMGSWVRCDVCSDTAAASAVNSHNDAPGVLCAAAAGTSVESALPVIASDCSPCPGVLCRCARHTIAAFRFRLRPHRANTGHSHFLI